MNAMAISNRLSRLRKKAADEGLIPQGGATSTTKGRKSNGVSTKAKGGKKGVTVAEASEWEPFHFTDAVHLRRL